MKIVILISNTPCLRFHADLHCFYGVAHRYPCLGRWFGGYLLGSYRSEPPIPLPVTLDATIVGVHPAALELRTAARQERHFLIDPLDRQWADLFVHESGKRWHLELKPSPYPGRYTVSTAVEE